MVATFGLYEVVASFGLAPEAAKWSRVLEILSMGSGIVRVKVG